MKKRLYRKSLLLPLVLCCFVGCQKHSVESKKTPKELVAYYAHQFMESKTFADFFKTTVSNSFKLNKLVVNEGVPISNRTNEIADTTLGYDFLAETITAEVMLKTEYPGFFDLTINQQIDVMNTVCNNLAVESYRLANSTLPLVTYATEMYQQVTLAGPLMRNTLNIDITWTEFMACTGAALGAVLGEYGGILRDVYNLFTQGSQALSWGSIFNIAKRVVRNAVPWYKVVSVAIGYAACLWAAA